MAVPIDHPNSPNVSNGDGTHTQHPDSEGIEDYASDMEEIRSEDFPNYFLESNDRLFPSNSPYPLPVDTPEQERLTLLHQILRQFLGALYIGPVSDVLVAPETGRRKMVLDLCTGNGKWVMDMSQEFPRVHFRGIDIVPITTRYPPPNVQFEIEDVNSKYRWHDGTFDLVHARSVSMAVRDYPSILQEIARVLRPGGLFVSCEWDYSIAFDSSFRQVPSVGIPATVRFRDALVTALAGRNIRPIPHQIPTFLANSGSFTDITVEEKYIPIGVWPSDVASQNIGADCLKVHERFADSVKLFLLQAGWGEAALERLVTDYLQEINTVSGLVNILHTVHARRL